MSVSLKNGFFLNRLVENSILGKNQNKKVSEFIRLPLQYGFAGSPSFSKKNVFFIFLKNMKNKLLKLYFKKSIFFIKKTVLPLFGLISIIYADLETVSM